MYIFIAVQVLIRIAGVDYLKLTCTRKYLICSYFKRTKKKQFFSRLNYNLNRIESMTKFRFRTILKS